MLGSVLGLAIHRRSALETDYCSTIISLPPFRTPIVPHSLPFARNLFVSLFTLVLVQSAFYSGTLEGVFSLFILRCVFCPSLDGVEPSNLVAVFVRVLSFVGDDGVS